MEDNTRNDRTDDQSNIDQDKLRDSTMNEMIREANGDPDMNLNELRDADQDASGDHASGLGGVVNSDRTQGMSYNPNDASAVRSGGTTDMDDQTAGGAGLNTGARRGLGSNLTPKTGVTGSDFDGQNRTS